jgi:hypothetical protein
MDSTMVARTNMECFEFECASCVYMYYNYIRVCDQGMSFFTRLAWLHYRMSSWESAKP